MTSYQSYFLCTAPRSGSTLLCRLLSATGVAGKPESYFHEPSLNAWGLDVGVSLDHAASESRQLDAVLDAVVRVGTADTGIFAARVQRHSFDYFIDQLARCYPALSTDRQRIERRFGTSAFIYLKREDKVRQAISFVKAEQSGLWHRNADGSELERLAPPAEPEYDAQRLWRQYQTLLNYDDEWEAWFAKEGIEPHRVLYETLSVSPSAVVSGILGHLGRNADLAQGLVPDVAKLSDQISQDWEARFRSEFGLGDTK